MEPLRAFSIPRPDRLTVGCPIEIERLVRLTLGHSPRRRCPIPRVASGGRSAGSPPVAGRPIRVTPVLCRPRALFGSLSLGRTEPVGLDVHPIAEPAAGVIPQQVRDDPEGNSDREKDGTDDDPTDEQQGGEPDERRR